MIHIHIFIARFLTVCLHHYLLSFSFINIRDSLYYHGLVIYYDYFIYCIYFLDLSVSMFVSLTPGFRMGIHVVFNLIGSIRKYWKFLNAIRYIYLKKFTNLTTPWQPFLIQTTLTPFPSTKTRKPDYILKYK